MNLDRKGIIEYVRDRVIQLRSEGKIDFDKTTGATIRMDMYRELYPGKINAAIKTEEERHHGVLDKMIGEGIGLGLTAPLKAVKVADVKLSEEEYKEINWDVRMALSKRGLTSADLEYSQEEQKLFKEFEAKRLEEKKAKFAPKKKPSKTPVTVEIVTEPAIEKSDYSPAEQELVDALTYVDDLKKLLSTPQAAAEVYLEMDRDLLIVWQRLEREGKPKDAVLVEAVAEIAPSRPRQRDDMVKLAQNFWQLFAKTTADAGKTDPVLADKLRVTYRSLTAQGLDKNQAMKETYRQLISSNEPELSRVRRQVFSQIFPRPIELRFKASFRNCRKPATGESPLPMGEALKTSLERAMTMAPSLAEKKALLDKMSRERRAFMPTGRLKRRKKP